MALVARDYERLGAHAVNIARRVVYLAGTADMPPVPPKPDAPDSSDAPDTPDLPDEP